MDEAIEGFRNGFVQQVEESVKAWNKGHPGHNPWKFDPLKDNHFCVRRAGVRFPQLDWVSATLSFEFTNSGEVIVRHFGKSVEEPDRTDRLKIVPKIGGGAFLCREETPDQELRVADAVREIMWPFLKEWSDGNLQAR
jgi:hypothetical protein